MTNKKNFNSRQSNDYDTTIKPKNPRVILSFMKDSKETTLAFYLMDNIEELKPRFYTITSRMKILNETEDLIQGLFLKLFNTGQKEIQVKDPKAYLITSFKNQCIEILRKRKSHKYFRSYSYGVVPDDRLKVTEEDSLDKIILKESCYECFDELSKLKEAYKQTILLHYFNGFSIKDCSNTLGVTQNTAQSRIHRGIKQLKAKYL
jgi:RNA polymerase sigma factor (sigma-70 family)